MIGASEACLLFVNITTHLSVEFLTAMSFEIFVFMLSVDTIVYSHGGSLKALTNIFETFRESRVFSKMSLPDPPNEKITL